MANDLVLVEKQLVAIEPTLGELLSPYRQMDPARLIRTVMVSLERTPRLVEASRQSIINAAVSAACLGLEVDGYTGQAFLIPFKVRGTLLAQLVIGYKGFTTMAARSGFTVTGSVVREGDGFEHQLGTGAYVRHTRALGGEKDRKIVATYAVAEALDRPPMISMLSIDEVMAIKASSPGAKRGESPWNDPAIGFPAMAEKSAKRRLSRSMPLNTMVLGAALDETVEERGKPAYIRAEDKALIVDGTATEITPTQPAMDDPVPLDDTAFDVHLPAGEVKTKPTIEQWQGFMIACINRIGDPVTLDAFIDGNNPLMEEYRANYRDNVVSVMDAYNERLKELGEREPGEEG